MQKTILGNQKPDQADFADQWFGIEAIAGIGVTSEAEGAPKPSEMLSPLLCVLCRERCVVR